MNDEMLCKPYRLSESEIYDLINAPSEEDFFRRLFYCYPVDCVNMQILYDVGIDKKLDRLFHSDEDKRQLVLDVVSAVSYASIGKKQHSPIIYECIKYIKEILENDYDAAVTTRELAEKYKISHYYLLHQFKSTTGLTVTDYKNELKLKRAKKLLLETDKTISEIAQETGFGSSAYFSKLFKRYMNVSPSSYKRIMSAVDKDY